MTLFLISLLKPLKEFLEKFFFIWNTIWRKCCFKYD